MPVTSKSQWRRFHAMYKSGEISKDTLNEWTSGVDYDKLPERKGQKKARKIVRKRTKSRAQVRRRNRGKRK